MQKNKILIEEREDGTLIGLSRDGVDPYVKKVGLTWEQTIAQLPFLKGMTDIAEEQWKLSPKNPSYTAPPKTEVKKVEPAKKAVPAKKGAKTKPEQPALTVSDEKNPVTSVTETAAIKPSESVVEPVKVEEPKILAPIASVAEAKANEPGQVAANLSKDSKVEPVTLTPCGTPPEGTPDNLINSPASGFPLTPAEEVRDHVG